MEITARTHGTSWPAVIIMTAVHLLGMWGILYAMTHAVWPVILAAVGYFFFAHVSIAIVHRAFTHNAFVMKPVVAYITMMAFSATGEGPAWWWRGKHMDHHRFSDVSGKDPHSPRDGFFHAHMGWLLTKEGISPPTPRSAVFDRKSVTGRAMVWQQQHYLVLLVGMNILVPALIGLLCGDILAGLLIVGATRQVFQWHMTWVVNSIGHTFGRKTSRGATNFSNWPLGLPLFGILTVGESEHGRHHERAAEWRLGTKWYHFDLTAWLIQILMLFGLVSEGRKT